MLSFLRCVLAGWAGLPPWNLSGLVGVLKPPPVPPAPLQGHLDQALKCYYQAIALNPSCDKSLSNCAAAQLKLGRWEDAASAATAVRVLPAALRCATPRCALPCCPVLCCRCLWVQTRRAGWAHCGVDPGGCVPCPQQRASQAAAGTGSAVRAMAEAGGRG